MSDELNPAEAAEPAQDVAATSVSKKKTAAVTAKRKTLQDEAEAISASMDSSVEAQFLPPSMILPIIEIAIPILLRLCTRKGTGEEAKDAAQGAWRPKKWSYRPRAMGQAIGAVKKGAVESGQSISDEQAAMTARSMLDRARLQPASKVQAVVDAVSP
jgi:hypothetical protein